MRKKRDTLYSYEIELQKPKCDKFMQNNDQLRKHINFCILVIENQECLRTSPKFVNKMLHLQS